MDCPLNSEQLELLANLPSVLNSSLQLAKVVEISAQQLKQRLGAEAATVFLLDRSESQLTFWVLDGAGSERLIGKKIPADAGIVGWVIAHQQAQMVNEPRQDARFFSDVDRESGFVTNTVMCAPLTIQGRRRLGAIQVLNKENSGKFSASDLYFLERAAHQVALAVGNAQLFEEMQTLSHQLAVLNRRKDDTLAVINHEFRTPLNLLQNSVELLTSGMLDAKLTADIKRTMLDGLQRLTQVVAKVRDVSRATSGALALQCAPVSASDLIQTLERDFAEACQLRRIQWSSALPAADVTVSGDATLLLVALKNLISNAIRFTPDGGSVRLAAEVSTGMCEFSVSDTGIGIEAGQLGLIFEKFYEVASTALHKSGTYEFRSGGLGLGLPTAKAIIEAHGATLEVQSAPHAGSTFKFSLRII